MKRREDNEEAQRTLKKGGSDRTRVVTFLFISASISVNPRLKSALLISVFTCGSY